MTKTTIRISSAAALCALLAVPAACSSDSNPGSENEAGTGGDTGSGGAKATGGSAGKASTGGEGGATGGAATVDASTGGTAGTDAGAGGASEGGTDGGEEAGTTPDAGTPDASPDSGSTTGCSAPADPAKAKLCLTFDPDVVLPVTPADSKLDNKGTLFIQVYDKQPLSAADRPIFATEYPPPTDPNVPIDTDLATLPKIDIDGMPATVYMSVAFVDNPDWLKNQSLLTYGMYVGGLDLTAGVFPPPALKPIMLTVGTGNLHTTHLTALRRFTTSVSLGANVTTLPDDGQGPVSVGAFQAAAPSGLPVQGGVQLGCQDITKGAIAATGFLYGSGDLWLVGQLDDFNQGGLSKPGTIVSLGAGDNHQSAPDTQKVTITDQYSVNVPSVVLNVVIPGFTGPTFVHYACPVSP